MVDSSELQKQVIEALAALGPAPKCPICGHDDWSVQVGTSYLPLKTESAYGSSWNQTALAVAGLICDTCGNTHLLNLNVLLKKKPK
jgi:hypothetical protein